MCESIKAYGLHSGAASVIINNIAAMLEKTDNPKRRVVTNVYFTQDEFGNDKAPITNIHIITEDEFGWNEKDILVTSTWTPYSNIKIHERDKMWDKYVGKTEAETLKAICKYHSPEYEATTAASILFDRADIIGFNTTFSDDVFGFEILRAVRTIPNMCRVFFEAGYIVQVTEGSVIIARKDRKDDTISILDM